MPAEYVVAELQSIVEREVTNRKITSDASLLGRGSSAFSVFLPESTSSTTS
jgi:hypothetical protein